LHPKLVDLSQDVLFTKEELVEAITHLAFYVGWPNAMSSVNCAKVLFAKKEGT